MDHPSAFDHLWNLLVGVDLSGAVWPETLLLGLLLAPWPMAVGMRRLSGSGGGWRVGRWVAGLYLYTRLAADFALWGPITAVVVTGAAARALAKHAKRGEPRAGLVASVAVPLGATALSLVWPDLAVSRLLLCSVLMGFVLAAPGIRQSTTAVEQWWRCAAPVWTGGVLYLGLDGLTLRLFVPMLLVGVAGWIAVGFELWRTRTTGRRRWVQGGLTAAAWSATALLGTAMFLEGYFRHIYDASDANSDLKTGRLWHQRHVRYNSWRYRDREFEPLDRFDDHLRVVILGDSFGFGPGIAEQQDLIGAQLESALNRRPPDGRPVSVFNLSRGGLTTTGELEVFRRAGLRLAPQVVVLVYMLNDINDGTVFAAINHPKLNPWRPLMDASYALEFIIWRLYERWFMAGGSPYPRELEYTADRRIFLAHQVNIEALVAAVRGSGAEMVAAVYPFMGIATDRGIQRHALDQVLAVFAGLGVPAIDVAAVVDSTDPKYTVSPFDPHPNAEVHRALAPVLAETVTALLASPQPSDSG